MAAGGKKDAKYLSEVMEADIVKFDPLDKDTDLLYFDGESSVQKC